MLPEIISEMYYSNGKSWWLIGRFVAFCLKGLGFESRTSCPGGTLGKWRVGVKLRHSICAVSGAPLSSSGLEEVL